MIFLQQKQQQIFDKWGKNPTNLLGVFKQVKIGLKNLQKNVFKV